MASWINININIDDTTPNEASLTVGDGVSSKIFTVTKATNGELNTTPPLTNDEIYLTTGANIASLCEQICQSIFEVSQYRFIQQVSGEPPGHDIWAIQPVVPNATIFTEDPLAPSEQILLVDLALSATTPGPFNSGDTVSIDTTITNQTGFDFTGITLSAENYSGPFSAPIVPDLTAGNSATYTVDIQYAGTMEVYIVAKGTVNGNPNAEALNNIIIS